MNYYGDFMGFQFGEYHSHDLGLLRVSDGSRYNDVSVPNFTDTTTKIPGGDGTYYWDSFYTQRTFNIQCAFDNLNEAQIRKIRQVFDGKVEDWLTFDEIPFKKYRVKLQSPPQMKYIAFGEGPTNRTYKGELTLQFISYTPYAINTFKYLDQANYTTSAGVSTAYPNKGEWSGSVKLVNSNNSYISSTATNTFYVYNPGDMPTDSLITFAAPSSAATMTLNYNRHGSSTIRLGQLILTGIVKSGSDTNIVIDSAKNLIYGTNSSGEKTGTLYNKYISAGDFFKIAVSSVQPPTNRSVLDYVSCAARSITVDYNYLYY